jgi:glycolate oxidase FAD binding subunit
VKATVVGRAPHRWAAIGGRQACYVAAPASTEEAAALLRAAAALGLTVAPRGAGRLQHW